MSHDAWRRSGGGRARQWLAHIKYRNAVIRHLGVTGPPRTCNVCGHVGRFRTAGHPPRYGARCPVCLSLERHRLLALCDREYQLFADRRVLHFSPEPSIARHVQSTGPRRHDLADIDSRRGQMMLDLERLALDDDTYDVVIASHVLEHVPDDRRAFREMARVLAPDGVAVLMVPIVEAWETTYENPEPRPSADDVEHLGYPHHTRCYGRDFNLRVESAGFKVEEFVATEPEVTDHGLTPGERVFLCRRVADWHEAH